MVTELGEAGSYRLSEFSDIEAELERLEMQATVGWELDRRIIGRFGPMPGHQVLDLGCGSGFTSRRLSEAVGNRGKVLGLDLNDRLLSIAQERNSCNSVSFNRGNVYDLSDYNSSFDFVYCRFLFQHLLEPERALEQIRQALTPAGRVTIVDVDDALFTLLPAPQGFEEFIEQAATHQRLQGGDRAIGRKLDYLLRKAGFTDVTTVVEVVHADQIGLQNFLDLNCSYKWQYFPESEQAAAAARMTEIMKQAEAEAVSAFCGIYAVSACRDIEIEN